MLANLRFSIAYLSRFFCINLVLLLLQSFFYRSDVMVVWQDPSLTIQAKMMLVVFCLLAVIGQCTLLSLLAGLPAVFSILTRSRRIIFMVAVLSASLLQLGFFVDQLVYHVYHLHLFGVIWQVLLAGQVNQVFYLSAYEKLIALIAFIVLLLCQWRLLSKLCGRQKNKIRHTSLYAVWCFGLLALLFCWLTRLQLDGDGRDDPAFLAYSHAVDMIAELVPYFNWPLSFFVLDRNPLQTLQMHHAGLYRQLPKLNLPLHYPRQPLHCSGRGSKLNVLVIVLDAWRFDAFNSRVTPHISAFAKQAIQFDQHYSGGNATGPGIFSLFYGIPYAYWEAALQQHRSPLLMQQFQRSHYQFALFRSASMHYPAFDETVFRAIRPLQVETKGAHAYQRDQRITQQFVDFLKTRQRSQPFFGFLFYDGSHNYCESTPNYLTPFSPAVRQCNRLSLNKFSEATPYWNRYRNALHDEDRKVGRVLEALEQSGELEKTVVIITSDHGEGFNDHHQNDWGHASRFDTIMLHVPFIVRWPGHLAKHYAYQTSHFDVAPTLMHALWQCPLIQLKQDMTGKSLWSHQPREFLAAGYVGYAYITPKADLQVFPGGHFSVIYHDGLTPSALLKQHLIHRFYQHYLAYFK